MPSLKVLGLSLNPEVSKKQILGVGDLEDLFFGFCALQPGLQDFWGF